MDYNYTKEFIDEVKELYPDYKEIHKLADEGSSWLGRYLDDGSSGGIALDTILTALTLEELQVKARLAKRKINLYKKWDEQRWPKRLT
jgi:hypothetical protein